MSSSITRTGAQAVPADVLLRILSYATSEEVCVAEGVCCSWNATIVSKAKEVWKSRYIVEKQHVFQRCEVIFRKFCMADINACRPVDIYKWCYAPLAKAMRLNYEILLLIYEYIDFFLNYKEECLSGELRYITSIQRGQVRLDQSEDHLVVCSKDGSLRGTYFSKWGNSEPEPFLHIAIFSRTKNDEERCWHKNPLPGMEKMVYCLPLRLFINRDGSYKNNGDELNLIWKGREIILTCVHELHYFDPYLKYYNSRSGIPVPDFRKGIEMRVQASFALRFLNQREIDKVKAIAASATKWIASDWDSLREGWSQTFALKNASLRQAPFHGLGLTHNFS